MVTQLKIISCLFFISLLASASEERKIFLDVHIASKHASDKKYNENNLGLGLTIQQSKYRSAKLGWYQNSYDKTSLYAGFNFRLDYPYIQPGIFLGVVSGYRNTISPFLLPTLALKVTDRHKLVLGYIPSINHETASVVTFSWQYLL